MTPFHFTYYENEFSGNYLFSNKGRGWIKVFFNGHSTIILPTTLQTKGKKYMWVQHISHGEVVWPHELIQAMGESITLTLHCEHLII